MYRILPLVGAILAFALPIAAGSIPSRPKPLPSYVTQYAPISHLFSGEFSFPGDVAWHIRHVVPQINFTNISTSVTFQTIGGLGSDVFLTGMDPIEEMAGWLNLTSNKPDITGFTPGPATIIVVPKPALGHGVVDAFYMYFYSFDGGNTGPGHPPGSHTGDWEHAMVRFNNGVPDILYVSAHAGGEAFQYNKTTLLNGRATTYIALGTHANYATPGDHLHGDNNTLDDRTDNGPIWDVTLNYRAYFFDNDTQIFTPAIGKGVGAAEESLDGEGVGWLNFQGMWGDEQYPIGEHGQFCEGANCLFASGPTGPIAKNLGRHQPCEHEVNCTILTTLIPGVS